MKGHLQAGEIQRPDKMKPQWVKKMNLDREI